jgi:hypothetical protein
MPNRIGAGTYLLVLSLGAIAWALALLYTCQLVAEGRFAFERAGTVAIVLNVLFGLLYSLMTPGRLRDLDFPRWLTRFTPLLLVSVIMAPLLLFYRSDRWDNSYGPPAKASGLLKKLLAIGLFVVAVPLTHQAMLTYLQMDQALRP